MGCLKPRWEPPKTTFYIVDRITPLCPQARQKAERNDTFGKCLDKGKSYRKAVEAALVPAAVAALVFLFHKLPAPLVLLTAFYALWTFYRFNKIDVPICVNRVWDKTRWMVAAGNFAPLAAFVYVFTTAADAWDPLLAVGLAGMVVAMLGGIAIPALLAPGRPHGVGFSKTGARDEHREYRRFLEDLADAWKMQDMCGGWLPYEHYNKLRMLLCRGDFEAAEKVSENWPLIFASYYLMFHMRNLEAAQKVLDLVKSRSLDEKDKAALEILEAARGAVENPPCSEPGALRRYAEKIGGVKACGWASVLKALVVAHLTDDEDYRDDVRLAILWTAKNRHCDSTSICYFAYRLSYRIKPLCRHPV
jgi:hypothetical protein